MDFGAIRAWLKRNDEICMITERTYRTLMDEQETDVVEFRLTMPYGDMDYIAIILLPKSSVDADREASLLKAFDRLGWETERDTRTKVNCPHALDNGHRFQQGQ